LDLKGGAQGLGGLVVKALLPWKGL
jgi:hypothetical protein